MSIQYEDSLLDFDLDFLHQSTNKSVIPEKPSDREERQRKSVSLAKKKIIATDSLIRKYYEKKEEVDQLERTLNISKDEYKQTCIEFRNIVEKCTLREQEAQKLRNSNVELQEKCDHSQNLVGAMQSHANQLQNLVKQKETTIESLTMENNLYKANAKDYEKKFATIQKENEELMRHICLVRDVVFGKKKLNNHRKAILLKYKKHYESDDNDSLFGDDSSDRETDTENGSPLLAHSKENALLNGTSGRKIIKGECVPLKDDNEHDSDCSNELASADTGRGSSLAFSDGEKCFNSPDYFVNHSPVHPDIVGSQKKNVANTATSPIPFAETMNVATSPVKFEYENIQITLSPLNNRDIDDPTDMAVSTSEFQDIDKTEITGTCIQSNMAHFEILSNNITEVNPPLASIISFDPESDIGCDPESGIGCDPESDICIDEETTSTSPLIIPGNNRSIDTRRRNSRETTRRNSMESLSEKECLEINNSNNLEILNAADCEIEMILHRMRLRHTLLTPIPNSPSKSTNAVSTSSVVSNASQKQCDNVCKDAEKIREDNKVLNAKIIELAQEIISIKDILRDKRLLHDNKQIDSSTINTRINYYESQPWAEHIVHTMSNCVTPPIEIKKKQTPSEIQILNQSKKETKKIKKLVNKIDFNKPPVSAHKSIEKDPTCHTERSDNSPTGYLTNSMANGCVIIKHATKNDHHYKSVFKAVVSQSKLIGVKKPEHRECSNSSVQKSIEGSEMNTSNSIAEEIDEDSLPLSSMLEFDRTESLHDKITNKESSFHKLNLNKKPQPKNVLKHRKLTRLQKIRNKLLPKSKIKNISTTPFKKLRTRPKELPILPKQISASDNAASLNDKDVYEKALKVMSELKSKEKVNISNSPCRNKPKKKGVNLDAIENKDEKVLINLNETVNRCTNKAASIEDQVAIENIEGREKMLSNVNKSNNLCINKARKQDIQVVTKNIEEKEEVLSNVNDKCDKELVILCDDDLNSSPSHSPKKLIATRSRSKVDGINNNNECQNKDLSLKAIGISSDLNEYITQQGSRKLPKPASVDKPDIPCTINNGYQNINQSEKKNKISDVNEEITQHGSRKRPKRASVEKPDIPCKRMLRSSTLQLSKSEENSSSNSNIVSNSEIDSNKSNSLKINEGVDRITTILKETTTSKKLLSYNDIDMFTCDKEIPSQQAVVNVEKRNEISPKDSIFCAMLDKFGKHSTKYSKKISDSVIASTSKLIEEEIASISELPPNDIKNAMNKLVDTILNWGYKQFMSGFMAYLKDPQRKVELFNKISSPPAPLMTKAEQILLYVISQLRVCWSSVDVVDCTLRNVEYMLFKLNRTPEFDTIESTSHFYAVVCRYFNMKSRLRLFMLDAMYCIQYKAVPLIKQCLEVWMHVLPLAHMGIAKSPLVTCMVYLLHFYKCEDRFNRVQDIRNILNRKYFFEITEWNEPKIIEMFKNAINEVRAIPMEIKLLRMALIVIAKRHGPRWCQNNIIKKLLIPMIESNVSDRVKTFCISLLGPLLKPYPVDMKVHCEIVMNQLLDILKQTPSHSIEEAVITSLIYMSKHNQTQVLQTLLAWKPQQVSPELEKLLRDFVTEKPLKAWKTVLSKMQIV